MWAQAKEDYLAGESAGAVCERYSLSRSRFFERAKAQGWRRRDQEHGQGAGDRAASEAEADAIFVHQAMEATATPAYQLARRAWAMAERAILMRRRIEAAGWVRVARDLRRLAMEEVGALDWERTVKRSEPRPPAADAEAAGPKPAPAPLPKRGPIPDSALTSERKLALWLEQELGPGVRALGLPGFRKDRPDSPDPSRRTPDSGVKPAPETAGKRPAQAATTTPSPARSTSGTGPVSAPTGTTGRPSAPSPAGP